MKTNSRTLRSTKPKRLSTLNKLNVTRTHLPTRNGWRPSNKVLAAVCMKPKTKQLHNMLDSVIVHLDL